MLMKRMSALCLSLGISLVLLNPQPSHADRVTVAVAANFKEPLQSLQQQFQQSSEHQLRIVSAASGVLYQQLLHGAPYDVFLSADALRPRLLMEGELAVTGSRFTYAIGQLVLAFEPAAAPATEAGNTAHSAEQFRQLLGTLFGKIAIANPDTAPYGIAAKQTLEYLHYWPAIQQQLVRGTNINQSFQYLATGNVDAALISYSQVLSSPVSYHYWPIPSGWHQPLQQQGILLQSAANNPAAREFMVFMQSPAARQTIAEFGYSLPVPAAALPPGIH